MSGHSKWSQIKRQKQKTDVKRGLVFTKIANAITIAVRQGGGVIDPNQNFRLRLIVDSARSVNMPKENIERAIQRALKKEAGDIEEVVYEGFTPGGVAIIIKATTDNKNRTTSEIKNLIEKGGGIFATQGAVSWMFQDQGLISVAKNSKSFDEIFETVADIGAEDIRESGNIVEVYTKPNDLFRIRNSLGEKGLIVQDAQLCKNPTTSIEIKDPQVARKTIALIDRLEELEDVQNVYANFEMSENLMESLKSE